MIEVPFRFIRYLSFFLFSIFLISCLKETDCIIIQDKYGGNGNFYFEWDRNGIGAENGQSNFRTGSVSEEEFNQYEIGDTYCVDQK